MRKIFTFFLFLLISQIVCSQGKVELSTWHLVVADSVSLNGISGATVAVCPSITFITDNNGKVAVKGISIHKNDTIRISCIGYKTLMISPKEKLPDTLRLARMTNSLREVVITNQSKEIILGDANGRYPGGYLPGPNMEIAEYIPNNSKISGTITGLEFALLDGTKGVNKPFKANLYAKIAGDLYPKDALIKDSIIVYNPKGLEKVSVDVSKYNIQLPENGLFVSFQTLDSTWYGNDKIRLIDGEHFHVPGLQGLFKDRKYRFDDELQEIPGLKYSLLQYNNSMWGWRKFEYGTDFAIGVTISLQKAND